MHQLATIAVFLLLATVANGQIAVPRADSPVVVIAYTHDAISFSNRKPLLLINNKRIPYENLQLLFFDLINIDDIKVYGFKKDSAKLYGRAARNGVIIIQTKQSVHWLSSKQIFRRQDRNPFHFYRNTLFIIDGNKIKPDKTYYLEKKIIESIKLDNEANSFYINKFYKRTITITTTLRK